MLLSDRIDMLDLRLINVALARRQNEIAPEIFGDLPQPYMEILSDLLEHSEVTLQTERDWAKRILHRLSDGVYSFDDEEDGKPDRSARPTSEEMPS